MRAATGSQATVEFCNSHDKEVDATFFGMHIGKVHGQVTNRVVLEFHFLLRGLRGRPAADAVALKQAVQGRAREVRNSFLQGVEAIIEGQLGLPAKSDCTRLLLGREHRRNRLRAHRRVSGRAPGTPLGHRFYIDPAAFS
ncbi:hypothetical protein BEN49_02865 [Hymenobacter coccineus]|uniref:Uncharacterized protein n=1 Tax=Hymenobacter coccineus TaxID=1908235 RepID=A0A1G1STZ9_9BACT|nr:hypothetical protein BEN49_02865 [Hymenobacter coccineus]